MCSLLICVHVLVIGLLEEVEDLMGGVVEG